MWPFSESSADDQKKTAYDFTFSALVGDQPLPLKAFSGKVILVVNTASRCGFTGQYDGLQKLYDQYRERGLVIIGVPSDNFGHQEPGTNDEIAHFCKLNYGVTFPMAAKENVVGDDVHPFYAWARAGLGYIGAPKWNFHKYLVNRQGKLVDYFYSGTAPDDRKLTKAIEELLDNPS